MCRLRKLRPADGSRLLVEFKESTGSLGFGLEVTTDFGFLSSFGLQRLFGFGARRVSFRFPSGSSKLQRCEGHRGFWDGSFHFAPAGLAPSDPRPTRAQEQFPDGRERETLRLPGTKKDTWNSGGFLLTASLRGYSVTMTPHPLTQKASMKSSTT